MEAKLIAQGFTMQNAGFSENETSAFQGLDAAYTYCDWVTREHSKSFYLSTRFLPADIRCAIRAFYAFCRVTDDMVDVPQHGLGSSAAMNHLAEWRLAARLPAAAQCHPVLSAWADTRDRYNVPQEYVEDLIDGCEMDLRISRYETFDELRAYCYRVASTVGLISMHIIGVTGDSPTLLQQAKAAAITLGIALQLTNILRDVGEDMVRGRIYLPLADMRRFRYTEDDLCAGKIDERFRALMQFQIDRTQQLYEHGWSGIAYLKQEGRLAVGAAISLYRDILDCIVRNNFDVFNRRAHLGSLAKLSRVPLIYLRVRKLDEVCLE
ncbi:MAG: squalene/phytoene synthase family protein [Chloroflexi bacterium]|nr:squalene/phytoene synthase family protein [Chloroflexota bacterium]